MPKKRKRSPLVTIPLFLLFVCCLPCGFIGLFMPRNPDKAGKSAGVMPAQVKAAAAPVQAPPALVKRKWPYQYVESRPEREDGSGTGSVMDLYAYSGTLNLDELRAFCRERTRDSKANPFYYLILFDEVSNARYPKTPFGAMYGLEEDALRHIRATFIYSPVNGYRMLKHYTKNAWEGVSEEERIELDDARRGATVPALQAAARDKPRRGELGYLETEGMNVVWVPIDETAGKELIAFSRAKNEAAVRQMMLQGRIMVCFKGVKVAVLDPGFFSTTVRILDGKHEGKLGVIDNKFLFK